MTPPGALSPTAALAAAGVLVVVGAAGVVARDVGGGGSEAGMDAGMEAAAPQRVRSSRGPAGERRAGRCAMAVAAG